MQTSIAEQYRNTPKGQTADRILRNCVHCGFCTATCPTYQILGDELDSPRGRIYLIKQLLEGERVTEHTRTHLDRCLTCRSCETTCPSGVEYAQLLDIGREMVEQQVPRATAERLQRFLMRKVFSNRGLMSLLVTLGRMTRPLLPNLLRQKIPVCPRDSGTWPEARHARRVLILDGCVQAAATPGVNASLARVLDRLGISLIRTPAAGCCGAMSQHMNAHEEAADFMRRNIDAWWPHIEAGAEALVVSASGCGSHIKDYGMLLADDPAYRDRAARVSALACDACEILEKEDLGRLDVDGRARPIAFHPPCTLQHGQQLPDRVEPLLEKAGYRLMPFRDRHLCCGSAGTYSLQQPELASELRDRKLDALQENWPTLIATANIGCQLHLQGGTDLPVVHWIELLDADSAFAGRVRP